MLAKIKGSLDRLPPAVRHFLVAVLGLALLLIFTAIRDHGGVIGVGIDWPALLRDTVNVVTASAAAVLVLALTPFTSQYGWFKTPSTPVNTGAASAMGESPVDPGVTS